jgi:hypothetical protein
MIVRAKFKCTQVEPSKQSEAEGCATIRLSAVYGNDDPNHENTSFFRWTPSGDICLGIVNVQAAKQFEVGKEYYVDFTPCN